MQGERTEDAKRFRLREERNALVEYRQALVEASETRRAAEHDLLAIYEEASGVAVDRDALRAAFLWNFGTPLALHLKTMKAKGSRWPERLPILERCLAAAEDWDAAALFG